MEPDVAYDSWRLVSLSPWPTWALALVGLAAAAGVVLAAIGLRKEPRGARRAVLLALRTGSMLAAVFVLLEPGIRLLQTARVKNRLAVLVDASASMAFPAEAGGASRAAVAARWLQEVAPALAELAGTHTLELYRFDRDLVPADRAALAEGGATPTGPRTDLLGALRAAAAPGAGGRKLAGAVIVSDGADNVDLPGADVAGPTRQLLEELRAPVSAVAVGGGELADVAVEDVKFDDFAFVRTTLTVEAKLRVAGMGRLDVPVVLRREGRVVAQQVVRADSGSTEYPLSFSFAPDQIGEFVFTLSAPAYEGEAVTANNARSFVLKVIRDRVRTLLVVGRPSWDERFLRQLLKQDPNVDLISFFILRTPQDDPKGGTTDLSLIPFPVDEIFDKQLKSFDLVVFQNFGYRPYQMDRYLPNIRRYVEEGGGFVMIGGEGSFGEGGYDQSPLADVLPVESTGQAPSEELFRPRLTEAGVRHPITQLLPGAEANRRAWESLPELPGVNVTRAKPGARVLLDHPHLSTGDGNAPVLVLGEHGRGRVMALTTDASWYWSMVAAGKQGGSSRVYERFWASSIRWLVRDPELTPVRVDAVSDEVEPGEPIAAVITARRGDYGPAAGAAIDLELREAETGKVLALEKLTADADGAARVELPAPQPGPYKLLARASLDGAELGQGEDAVAVRAASAELSDAAPRPELLRAIAKLTGGGFVEASDGKLPDLGLAEPEVVEVGRSKDRPIWDRLWSLAALGILLAAEWVLRRRWGYF